MLAFVEPFENGTVTQKKALLHALVAAVRVKGQNSIQPIFRVPTKKVRLMACPAKGRSTSGCESRPGKPPEEPGSEFSGFG